LPVALKLSEANCHPKSTSTFYTSKTRCSIDLTVLIIHLQDFSSSWDIRATPTFFFLKNGQEVDKLVGANKPELEKKVEAIASSR
jgi:thiol-disulfide isomerase/thioredoxin